MSIEQSTFGTLNGQSVPLFTLRNQNNLTVSITPYGGTVTSIRTPDRQGQLGEITLGFPTLEPYLTHPFHFGATVGRFANRIANGRFILDNEAYNLQSGPDGHTLHGGPTGWGQQLWEVVQTHEKPDSQLLLRYESSDGEGGFPGRVTATVTYTLTQKNRLVFDYAAETDRATPINLTNHCYFNLHDGGRTSILNHELRLFGLFFTPTDRFNIPTGEIRSVKRSPFSFLRRRPIGGRIDANHQQLQYGNGYDHNYVLPEKEGLQIAARVVEPQTGRRLDVWTTEPGLQFYTGNWLDGQWRGHSDIPYAARSGFCLETQHFPDSPNRPNFPSAVLRPNAPFHSRTEYRFGVVK